MTPTPLISRVVACSVADGANSLSTHKVARLMKFIVIIGVRSTGKFISRATSSSGWVALKLRVRTMQGAPASTILLNVFTWSLWERVLR